MKLARLAALALTACSACAPALASTVPFTVDFEKSWDYGAEVGSSYQASTGISFTNFIGLSNDALGPYFSKSASSLGVAYVLGTAYMNVDGGMSTPLTLFYSSAVDLSDAIKAYTGLDGTGDLLGSWTLAANDDGSFSNWTSVTLTFSGLVQSFDFSGAAGAGLDDFSTVPEPSSALLLLASGLAALGAARRRRG